jgi:hypothetical protein
MVARSESKLGRCDVVAPGTDFVVEVALLGTSRKIRRDCLLIREGNAEATGIACRCRHVESAIPTFAIHTSLGAWIDPMYCYQMSV